MAPRHSIVCIALMVLPLQVVHGGAPYDAAFMKAQREYTNRLLDMEHTVASHVELAIWCRQHGLPDRAEVHYREALALDPECADAKQGLAALRREEQDRAAETSGDKAGSRTEDAGTEESSQETVDEGLKKPKKPLKRIEQPQVPVAPLREHASIVEGSSQAKRGAESQGRDGLACWHLCAAVLLLGLLVCVVVGVMVRGVRAWHRRHLLRAITLSGVDQMKGHDFERYVARLMTLRGFEASVTPGSRDFGVDIVASRGSDRYAVQVKRASGRIGQSAVRQAVAGSSYYGCNAAMVVTNSYFSPAAKKLAESNNCILVNRPRLANWIADARK